MSTTVDHQALPRVGADDKIKDEIILAMAHELKHLRDQLMNRSQHMAIESQEGKSSHASGESLRRQLEDVLRARENERSVYVRWVDLSRSPSQH